MNLLYINVISLGCLGLFSPPTSSLLIQKSPLDHLPLMIMMMNSSIWPMIWQTDCYQPLKTPPPDCHTPEYGNGSTIMRTYLKSIYYTQVNLCDGVPANGALETCTAGAGTLTVEFGVLSRLLGDPVYENLARKAVRVLWDHRHPHTGLLGQYYTGYNICCHIY